jgi:hypothetical protein
MNHATRLLLVGAALTACALAQDAAKAPAPVTPITWKDLVSSGTPLRFYGFFRLDAYYNTARMDSVVLPSRVLPETKRNDDQFFLDPRLTRFGFDVTPADVEGTKVGGKLEIDFANFPTGSSESRATPRIRLAYIDIAKDQYGLRVGQDWDVVSPIFPTANGELLMWNAGNIGDRRAQIQGRWNNDADASKATFGLKAALGLTGAINNEDLDTTAGERDGFDSGMPHAQVRAGYKGFKPVESRNAADIGAWGMFGRTQTDTAFNGETRFDTWCGGLDFTIPLTSAFTARGEVWTGQNLGDIRGGIAQTINTATGEEIASSGGWAELQYEHTKQTKFHVGATLDDPEDDDLSTTLANANKRRNQAAYIGTIVDWDTKVRTGFDVIYWETDYTGAPGTNGSSGNTVRLNLYFQFNF